MDSRDAASRLTANVADVRLQPELASIHNMYEMEVSAREAGMRRAIA